jgi:hypothetical protein
LDEIRQGIGSTRSSFSQFFIWGNTLFIEDEDPQFEEVKGKETKPL